MKYTAGERLDIMLRDVVVMDQDGDELTVQYQTPRGPTANSIALDAHGVTVARIAPPEWPPLPGDVWRDGDNALWFCTNTSSLVNARQSWLTPDALLRGIGRLTLVYREMSDVAEEPEEPDF